MKSSPELFELVSSLSASEKRYFKLFAKMGGGKGDSKYLRIFEALEKMEAYDEPALLKQFADPKFKRQYPVLKKHLYKLIIKSLRNYHSERSVDFQIRELLMDFELLMARGLPHHARKRLSKASKLALDNERHEILTEIGVHQVTLAMKASQGDLDLGARQIEAIFRESEGHSEQHLLMERYRLLSLKLLFLSRRETVIRSAKSRADYSELMADPLLTGPAPVLPHKARMFYHQAHFIHHIALSDFEKAFDHGAIVVETMESQPWIISERPENYLSSLQNLVAISTMCKPLAEIRALLDKMRSLSERLPKVKFGRAALYKMPLYAYNHELHLLISEGKKDEAAAILPAVLEFLDKHPNFEVNVNEGIMILYLYLNLVHVFILLGKFEQAKEFLGLILDSEAMSGDYELYRDARILKVMVMFELGEEESLEYSLLSLYRFLQGQEKLFKFEKAWIDFIRKSSKRPPGTPLLHYFHKLREDLEGLKNDPAERAWLGKFDLLRWLEEKIAQG